MNNAMDFAFLFFFCIVSFSPAFDFRCNWRHDINYMPFETTKIESRTEIAALVLPSESPVSEYSANFFAGDWRAVGRIRQLICFFFLSFRLRETRKMSNNYIDLARLRSTRQWSGIWLSDERFVDAKRVALGAKERLSDTVILKKI